MHKEGKRVPPRVSPAAYFAQLCGDEFDDQPGISEINKWLIVLDY
jgi:hypothetical protein